MVDLALIVLSAYLLEAKKKTSLAFKSVFLSTEGRSSQTRIEKNLPDILFMARILGKSLGKDATEQEKNLKDIFRLEELPVRYES